MRFGELQEMAVSSLFRTLDPGRKVGDIVIVGDERELQNIFRFQAKQQGAHVRNRESILRSLCKNSNEPEFCDRTPQQFPGRSHGAKTQRTSCAEVGRCRVRQSAEENAALDLYECCTRLQDGSLEKTCAHRSITRRRTLGLETAQLLQLTL